MKSVQSVAGALPVRYDKPARRSLNDDVIVEEAGPVHRLLQAEAERAVLRPTLKLEHALGRSEIPRLADGFVDIGDEAAGFAALAAWKSGSVVPVSPETRHPCADVEKSWATSVRPDGGAWAPALTPAATSAAASVTSRVMDISKKEKPPNRSRRSIRG